MTGIATMAPDATYSIPHHHDGASRSKRILYTVLILIVGHNVAARAYVTSFIYHTLLYRQDEMSPTAGDISEVKTLIGLLLLICGALTGSLTGIFGLIIVADNIFRLASLRVSLIYVARSS